MGLIFTLRMLGDLSLYLCVASTIARLFGLEHLHMVPLFILTACCGLCYAVRAVKSPLWRLSPLALMLLCGFFVYSLVDFLLLLPAAGFCAVTCYRQLFAEDKLTYRTRFLTFVKVLVPLVLLGLLMGRDTVEGYTLPFALLALLTGIYLMQILRQSEAVLRQKRFRLLNLATLLAATAVGLVLSTPAALAGLRVFIGGVYAVVVVPILLAMAYVFVAIAWLLAPLFRWIFAPQAAPEEEQAVEGLDSAYDNLDFQVPEELTGQLFLQVMLALLIIGLLIAAVLVLRRMLGRRTAGRESPHVEAGRAEATAAVPRLPLLRRSPREQVRAAFRRFLLLCRAQGMLLIPGVTSQEAASRAAGSFWCPEDTPLALRALYIKARYSEHEVSRQEAQLAREHLAAIRRSSRKNGT